MTYGVKSARRKEQRAGLRLDGPLCGLISPFIVLTESQQSDCMMASDFQLSRSIVVNSRWLPQLGTPFNRLIAHMIPSAKPASGRWKAPYVGK